MTSYKFDPNIPAAGNKPSDDQPKMKINNSSINSIWDVDHFTFGQKTFDGVPANGKHRYVRIAEMTTQGGYTNPESVVFTNRSSTSATIPQLYWKSQQGKFVLSGVRAFISFNAVQGADPTVLNASNCVVAGPTPPGTGGVGTYTITLTANAVESNSAVVLVTASGTIPVGTPLNGFTPRYSRSFSSGVMTITVSLINAMLGAGTTIDVCVIQT